MTHLLRITDGTNTVTMSSGNMFISSYVPQSSNGDYVTEEPTIGFSGGTTIIRSNVQSINRLFQQARNYMRSQTGPRVYVEFDPDSSGTVYRSMLYDAEQVILTDDILGGAWGSGVIELDLSWTREPFWDGPLTQIPLTNTSASGTTDSIAVNNRNDALGENWVSISSSDIVGDLPADIKLEMINGTTDANASDDIYLWHNVYSTPATFNHIIEGESSTNAVSTTDANSNSLAYGAFSWATTTETKIAEWTLPSSDVVDASGGRFSILARFPAVFPYTDCRLRFKLQTTTTYNDLWVGNLVLPATTTDNQRELVALDTFRLPPYLQGQSSIKEISLALFGLRSSTDNTVNIDYLQLSPISGDGGWKRFKSVDNGVGIDETFVFDATEGFIYKQDSAGNAISEFTDYGGPVRLVPNVTQKLYINTCDYLGAAETSQTWNVKLWYRPRRSSI